MARREAGVEDADGAVSPSREAASGSCGGGRHAPTTNGNTIDNLIRALQEQQTPPIVASVKANETSEREARAKAQGDRKPKETEATAGDERAMGRKRKSKGSITVDAEVECGKGEEKAASRELCLGTIETALEERRIDEKKAKRLRDCIYERNWADVSYRLLCEQIPKKRKGKSGYQCRVCLVPLKGHTCPYCPVCSTAHIKFMKSESHNCVNCPACFDAGKRRKKVVQISVDGHACPHAAS